MSPASLDLEMKAAPASRWRMGSMLLLAIALGLSVWMEERRSQAGADLEREQVRAEELGRKTGPVQSAIRAPDPETGRQLQRARVVLEQLSTRWDELFATVEAAGSGKLALLTLVPDIKSGSLRLGGEAPSLEEVLRYVERLGSQPRLDQVHLISYEAGSREGINFVQFVIGANWKRP